MSLLSVAIPKKKRLSLAQVKSSPRETAPKLPPTKEEKAINSLLPLPPLALTPRKEAKEKEQSGGNKRLEGFNLLASALLWLGTEPYSERELINGLLYEKRKKLKSLIERAKKYTQTEIEEARALIDTLTREKILKPIPGGKYEALT